MFKFNVSTVDYYRSEAEGPNNVIVRRIKNAATPRTPRR